MEATIVRVVLVAPVPGAERVRHLTDELCRDSLHVEITSADVLRRPPEEAVYVFCFDAGIAVAVAPRIAEWSSEAGRHVGTLGVIEDGGGEERETLLAAGFDDVVTGRLSVRELSGRVRAIHRRMRRRPPSGRDLRFAVFALDLVNYQLRASDSTIPLTPIELAVMRELIKARGKPLSRVELLAAAWGEGELEVTERAVDNVVLRLRRKLPQPDAIETVRGIGFRIAG